MQEEQSKDLKDYLDAFKRRRWAIMGIALTIFVIGVITALALPPTYRSAATILIEEQQIPSELVQSTVTSYAAQRIQTISQRVMTRQNLMDIIERFGLYVEDRKRYTTEEILATMRADIKLDMISAEVVDPRTGRPTAATIAFSLGFHGENPQQVQRVANELTTLYLQENIRSRTLRADETYNFLADEAERLTGQIATLEERLAEFKTRNADTLPELQPLLRQQADRTELELSDIANQIRAQEERRFYLQGQLGQIEPHGSDISLSPGARLKALRTEYISLVARYSPDHPDVKRVKREITGLERETGQVESSSELLEQLDGLRTELASARERYSEEHPDVLRLTRAIAGVEEAIASADDNPGNAPERAPDNPAYVNLQAQLNAVDNQINSLTGKRASVEARRTQLEERLAAVPLVEAEYRTLTRNLENATAKYQEMSAKLMQAQVARQLESESRGERFTLIEPAVLPEEPIKPNRPAIIFLSLVLALGAGLGYAAVAESLDSSVRGVKGIMNAVQAAPLAVIPYLANDREVKRGKRKTWIIVALVLAAIGLVVLLFHLFVSPLDVLWFRVLRRASNTTGLDL
ncbi:MAG: Wzz/FepE/Etk N-terminal domain-containing protein [Gammaproteobacteria bacterium]|nr:Wzz/FepE/Etk N-terminal domain-containing protein [Gammaproteobacteria bacterium]